MEDKSPHEAIVFDLFGTLVCGASDDSFRRFLEQTIQLLGAEPEAFVDMWTSEEMRRLRATGGLSSSRAMVEEACRRLAIRPGDEAVQAAVRLRKDAMRAWLRPWPDAAGVLDELHRAGYRLALMSDCTVEVPDLFDRLAFSGLFRVRLFSCELGTRKPDPAMYALACERLGIAPGRCLYVGDGASQELSGARRAGMDAVLIDVPGHADNVVGREEARDWTGPRVASLTGLAGRLRGATSRSPA